MEGMNMDDHRGSFATGLDCADGRTKEPVLAWARANLKVQWVDFLTRAGMDGSLLDLHPVILEDLRRQLLVLLEKHNSRHVLIVGHCECVGNPVSADEHRKCVAQSAEIIHLWNLPEGIEIIGLLVNREGTWQVEVVPSAAKPAGSYQ